jgi:NADPH2:quinone reductase
MNQAIRIHQHGGPEVLELEPGEPGPAPDGHARIKHNAIGVNFIDTYHRSGLYPVALPSGLGVEGAGVVEQVGSGVTHVKAGDRVAYAGGPPGAYATGRLIPAHHLVKLPDAITDSDAAAVLLQGMTVYSLITRTFAVKAGQTVLWHAAAGGVGLIACQWLRALGVNVIGTVSTDEKADLALANGCTHTIVYTREKFPERVRELTGGAGVPVVFDSVGNSTWEGSLDCLQPFGLMVSFGNASGPVAPFSIGQLAAKGSLYVTRPALTTYVAKRADLEKSAAAVFEMIASGTVKPRIGQVFGLRDAAQAHRALESRSSTGATILMP